MFSYASIDTSLAAGMLSPRDQTTLLTRLIFKPFITTGMVLQLPVLGFSPQSQRFVLYPQMPLPVSKGRCQKTDFMSGFLGFFWLPMIIMCYPDNTAETNTHFLALNLDFSLWIYIN